MKHLDTIELQELLTEVVDILYRAHSSWFTDKQIKLFEEKLNIKFPWQTK